MAMKVKTNTSATNTLNRLNKNARALGKSLQKLSSGMEINSAGDDASGYSISERMRVRLQSLEQDENNVQNGASLLRVAEGAIQQQLEIMKQIKKKVIDADNDTNTDLDRATIQKEINQSYDEIENIAFETTYNGKRLLVGDTVAATVESWRVTNTAVLAPDSDDLNAIPENYSSDPYVSSDGTKYDKFTEWSTSPTTLDALGLAATNTFSGGATVSTPRVITLDLSACNASTLNNNDVGIGFYVDQGYASSNSSTRKYFVLTKDSSATYNIVTGANSTTQATKIVVNSSMSKSQIAQAMATAINGQTNASLMKATVDGEKVVITTQSGYTDVGYANNCTAYGFKSEENPAAELYTYDSHTTGSTGISWGYLSGGNFAVVKTPDNPDAVEQPARPDTLTRNVAGVTSGTGIRLYGPGGSGVKLTFVDGASGYSNGTIGKSFNGTATIAGLSVTMDGSGNITFSTPHTSSSSYRAVDGLETTSTKRVTGTVAVKAMKSLTDLGATRTITAATNSSETTASCELDLTAYTGKHDESDMEDFISAMKGKLMTWSYRTNKQYNYSSYRNSQTFGFIDTGGTANISPATNQSRSRDALLPVAGATAFDLNELRGLVSASQSVADVVSDWLKSKLGNNRVKTHNDDSSIDEGKLKFQANLTGKAGNDDRITIADGTLRSYDLDFASSLEGKSIPEDLNGRGFRVYCATHHGQWFNFELINGMESLESKPKSGTETLDIKTLLIDVSAVRDANDLVAAIYDQAMPTLTSGDSYWDHYFRLAADTENGTLTIYDRRTRNVNTGEFEYQIHGAKVADGVLDNVVKSKRKIYVKDLVIQHTDRANQNIHVRIPQTTMDHIFGFLPENKNIKEFNVFTAQSREELLGNQAGKTRSGNVIAEDEKGYLDKAIDYLTDANTLIGAQISRLRTAETNIVTSQENTTASESTIRDADMAKEMATYTKNNVLLQASQSMLSQANQNSSQVLSLLQ